MPVIDIVLKMYRFMDWRQLRDRFKDCNTAGQSKTIQSGSLVFFFYYSDLKLV